MSATSTSAPTQVRGPAAEALDLKALADWLAAHVDGFGPLQEVTQFQGGLSNPTFLVKGSGPAYVLRKQPSGHLLPSAHALDREFRVLQALRGTPVPVPEAVAYCSDPALLQGTFYLMAYVPGRIYADVRLADCDAAERRPTYAALARTLAALHGVDWRANGLNDFGKPQSYLARQIARWSRQFTAAAVPSDDMDQLTAWVQAHVPARDAYGEGCTLVHGDYRLGNAIFDARQPDIRAVLDWELATIGHPLADLAYSALAWRLPGSLGGLLGHEDASLPSESEYLAAYSSAAGLPLPADYEFYVAFSLFRWAAILAGVYRRALDADGTDARGMDAGRRFHLIAGIGSDVIRKA